ncbi:MAG: TonB-dependent receptor plug domain-containing protein, partial [Bacteroidota bacterium]
SQLQLKDEFGKIWAERFFYNQDKTLKIRLKPLDWKNRKARYSVTVLDENDLPVKTTLSVGLRTKSYIAATDSESNTSDTNRRNQRYWDDLLAVTGESSHFLSPNKDLEIPSILRYSFQKGLDFYGQAYDLNQALLAKTKIQVLIWAQNEVFAEEVTTNTDGLFKLTGLDYEGAIKMAFRTKGATSKTKLVRVIPYEMETPPLTDPKSELRMPEELIQVGAQQSSKGPDGDFQPMAASENVVSLNEIILEKKQDHKKLTPSVYSIKPSVVRYQDPDKPKTIPQLFLGIPGVQIANLGDLYPTINLFKATGAGSILWVLDGLPLIQPTSLVQIMNIVNYNDIERIELLTGSQGAIYGARGAGGVIAIYTKDGNENGFVDRKEAQLQYEGYHESVTFDTYIQGVSKKIRQASGQTSTVYWNPVLKTNEEGEAIISFEIPKDSSALDIEIWGTTPDGKRGTFQGSQSLRQEIGI